MRYHYFINGTTCHFHYNKNEPLHEVESITSLFNLSQETKKSLIQAWHARIVFMPDRDPSLTYAPVTFFKCIPEIFLDDFIHQADAKQTAASILRPSSLAAQIINSRLDAIVGNITAQHAYASAAVRKNVESVSGKMYRFTYEAMDTYERNKKLSEDQVNAWRHIKNILPRRSTPINERHLFALLLMIAPHWPAQGVFALTQKQVKINDVVCKVIEIMRNKEPTDNEKSFVFLEAIKNITISQAPRKGSTDTELER
ncbi:hypothetical protein CXF92_00380 [Pseudomonas sp. Choline-3u-10]|uniref:hypothetical protein n=1 Tax=Pseudomonas sp. Choline-3u-10 TaxID=2058311 RepID=UPI000C34D4E5|nr:hypothetical protein [Pseudomonas sp. Choline-3u-10]PKG96291.1 hypothetical protein CXF92_00380 [Pseudomonas sp. Choline-3u-10]